MIKVGISAWTEKTLIASGWYPPGVRDAEGRLRYYAGRFPLVEVDSPYYALPEPEQAERWVERTPEGFTMNVKAHALMTGHYTDAHRLPPDLNAALPAPLRAKPRLYARELDAELVREVGRRFRAAIEPLRAAGRLGLVLLQYPVWFPFSRTRMRQILETRALLPGCRVAVELRNATWLADGHRDFTLAFLREHGLVYTCVDEPQGFASSVPPIAAATSAALALVRFHGRNARTWARTSRSAAERLDYRYRLDELREWVPRIAGLADQAAQVHVIMNNCHRDHAVTNAWQMAGLLEATGHGRVRPRAGPPLGAARAAAATEQLPLPFPISAPGAPRAPRSRPAPPRRGP